MAASTTTTTSSSGGMDKRLMKAATSGASTSMYAMAALDRSILLGTTPYENTCLHISCIYGHEGFCKDVLELEESLIKAVNLDGETPLITAVRNGHVSLASFLLAQHCSVLGLRQAILQQDVYGFNALHHAIRNGHKDHALELIAAEPALSQAVGKHNESPMYFAVMRNFTQVFEKLMQNPLSASSGGQHGRNCLHAAVKNGDQEFVKIIMKERPELAREADTSKNTPIANAVQYDKVDILQVMLEHDSTLGYLIGNNGLPLLNIAAYRGLVAAAQKLLEHCPDAPYLEPNGSTLLHKAVFFDQPDFVEFVLRTPILRKLVNMQDKNGRTALHLAVARCNPRAVAALLSHVDIDATLLDNKGDTAAWELYSVMKNAKTINWASASSSASNSEELDELNYKHAWSEEDLNLLKEQAAAAEMEALRAELKKAQAEAEQQRVAAEKSSTELSEEQDARRKDQARILEVEQDLKGLYAERDVLQADKKKDAAELKRLELARKEAQVQARSDGEELRQVSEIAAGAFADLPRSAADACQYFNGHEDAAEQKAFWAQFQVPSHPPLLGDQMKQLMELHRVARPVMEDLCIALWPVEPLPSSYFGLIQRLQSASPRVQLWKRSACLEGARHAFASVKAYYPRVNPEEIAKGAPEGTKRVPEQYFNDVMPGARISEAKCRKDTILEDLE